jgi:hypothetical protein
MTATAWISVMGREELSVGLSLVIHSTQRNPDLDNGGLGPNLFVKQVSGRVWFKPTDGLPGKSQQVGGNIQRKKGEKFNPGSTWLWRPMIPIKKPVPLNYHKSKDKKTASGHPTISGGSQLDNFLSLHISECFSTQKNKGSKRYRYQKTSPYKATPQ